MPKLSTPKKYDNRSPYPKDWTNEYLKKEAISLDSLIYDVECYHRMDMIIYSGIIMELEKRGVKIMNKLVFDEVE